MPGTLERDQSRGKDETAEQKKARSSRTGLDFKKGVRAGGSGNSSAGTQRASADGAHVRGLETLRALRHIELDLLSFRERPEAISLDRGVVTENVLTPVVLGDETKTLRVVEPLHGTFSHLLNFFLY
jgi:hypothetical protein